MTARKPRKAAAAPETPEAPKVEVAVTGAAPEVTEDKPSFTIGVKPRRYVEEGYKVGQLAPKSLYLVNGKVTDEVEPGQSAVSLCTKGAPVSRFTGAYLADYTG